MQKYHDVAAKLSSHLHRERETERLRESERVSEIERESWKNRQREMEKDSD